MTELSKDRVIFDFEAHRKSTLDEFTKKRHLYDDFARAVKDILADAIDVRGLKVNEIQCRAKSTNSLGKKVMIPLPLNPFEPKYKNPLHDITDLAGVRVITFFPKTVAEVCQLIQEEFEVIEQVDHTASAEKEERLGYLSVHYVVRLSNTRNKLAEYRKYDGLKAEIQVRTVLQHAWAEIEHDIRYKSTSVIPQAISRRFMTLAGLLEIADREFEAIQAEDASIRANALILIEEGRLDDVEVTPDALHSYLDIRLGPDERISDYNYEWNARILRDLGFQNLGQLHECIQGLDDTQIGRIALGGRRGQVSRFEVLLIASMGPDNYLKNHPFSKFDWFRSWVVSRGEKLSEGQVSIGSYQPRKPE